MKDPKSTASNKKMKMQLVAETKLVDTDILCGQNKRCLSHPGSLRFKSAVEAHAGDYREAHTRTAKMAVVNAIIRLMKGRRFLKFNDKVHSWEVLRPLNVRDKIGHVSG